MKNPEDLAIGIKEATKLGRKAVLVRVKSGDQTRFVAVQLKMTGNKANPKDLFPGFPVTHVAAHRFTVVPASAKSLSVTVADIDKGSGAAKKGIKEADAIKEIGGVSFVDPADVAKGVSEAVKLGRKAVCCPSSLTMRPDLELFSGAKHGHPRMSHQC